PSCELSASDGRVPIRGDASALRGARESEIASETSALKLLALPAARGALVGRIGVRAGVVDPAEAGERAHVDVHELAPRVDADAHAAGVQRLREGADLRDGHPLDADVAGRAPVVEARLLALVAESRHDVEPLAE